MLKEGIWTRKQIIAKVMLIKKNQVVEETTLLKEIQRNNTKEQEVVKKLEKNDGQVWEKDEIIYIKERIYILNNQKI